MRVDTLAPDARDGVVHVQQAGGLGRREGIERFHATVPPGLVGGAQWGRVGPRPSPTADAGTPGAVVRNQATPTTPGPVWIAMAGLNGITGSLPVSRARERTGTLG